ncbi:MAG TPA: hypothetical protein VLE70_05855 [Anaerolineae bacterium]|nr:hypothetical protein [Anaerolineae bacterium]
MAEERIETGKAPSLQITCPGSLKIKGWTEPAVLVKGASYELTEGEKATSIELAGDSVLLVPAATTLSIAEVAGDLAIRNVDGQITVSAVTGDVNLRGLAGAELGTVSGDLAVRHLNGPLSVDEVMGDASLRSLGDLSINNIYGDLAARNVDGSVDVTSVAGDTGFGAVKGNLSLEKVHGDVNLRNIGGLCQVTEALGDIRLRGGLTKGKHHLSAAGNIAIRWPAGAPLIVDASAPHFNIRLPLEEVVEEDGHLSGKLGDGDTVLLLESKGRIILKETDTFSEPWGDQPEDQIDMEFDFDLSGLGQHIATEINNRIGEWSSRFESSFDPEISVDVERRVRDAAARAERAAERAMRQAEKAARKARWQAQSGGWTPPPPPTRPATPKERKATEAEQPKILRMVENGVISPDEAATLLEAIENG